MSNDDRFAPNSETRRKLAQQWGPWYDRAVAVSGPLVVIALIIVLFLRRHEIMALLR